ncbi:MAG: CapA family protein [Bacillota bacterium]
MYQSERGELELLVTGDSLITRPLSCHGEEAFSRLVELVRAADVSFTNLEVLLGRGDGFPAAESGGTYTLAEPRMACELRWMGFDLFSRANNHALDYGIEGLLTTSSELDRRGLSHAGVGRNLAEARSPAYLELAQGRVALLSASSTFAPSGRAGEQRPDMPGRPGLNPLRYHVTVTVDSPALEALRAISEQAGYERLKAQRKQWMPVQAQAETEFDFFGTKFVSGEVPGITTRPHQEDLGENAKWVKDARRQADWVVFSLHTHESGSHREEPAAFAETFARACIDAGADVVVGHGPHLLRGIEIYQGRPIFYSLGNFIFQNETVLRLPADIYSRYRLGHDATPADLYDARTGCDQRGFPADPVYWESVAAICEFSDHRLARIRLYPVTLGHGKPRVHRGRPLLAQGRDAERIITRLAALSKPYGTRVQWRDGMGIIEP